MIKFRFHAIRPTGIKYSLWAMDYGHYAVHGGEFTRSAYFTQIRGHRTSNIRVRMFDNVRYFLNMEMFDVRMFADIQMFESSNVRMFANI